MDNVLKFNLVKNNEEAISQEFIKFTLTWDGDPLAVAMNNRILALVKQLAEHSTDEMVKEKAAWILFLLRS